MTVHKIINKTGKALKKGVFKGKVGKSSKKKVTTPRKPNKKGIPGKTRIKVWGKNPKKLLA